ncbi:transcriptional regulator, MarR family [Desulfofarcimen acetoxidans DSM 771]|jgi:DNA-binding MarR family transcriptional regulator|uniref:Transcriptional regulator, MarR family n=1 Tax=Desulfofarcimen acetoxidans (strain ATCC 49208 / DSM 771 / KCTC 5769 / VKM B-1644 / 5575) TaxID=485916 RepID=C8W1T6_DESAS|nr:MarR family winged helix-turn-helix transcriptional regulator [Desulfofarcimen acetoxidans]ACV63557.1 transcriptional regulator, MarR family [Desulfofarcimen acetoxidans DSM 771]
MKPDNSAKENLREISKETGKKCVCFNLRKASRLLSQIYDQALKPAHLKVTQFSLLMAIAGREDITIGKLARPLGMDRTTLSRNARILEKKGLLIIEDGEDRRQQSIRLTEDGASALRKALPLWEGIQESLSSELGEEKMKTLLEDLQILTKLVKRK